MSRTYGSHFETRVPRLHSRSEGVAHVNAVAPEETGARLVSWT